MEPRVWRKGDKNIPRGAVYVGRPTEFGNPFTMKSECERDLVCEKFEAYILRNPKLMSAAKRKLRYKHLICFCAPKRCHADVLLKIANE